MGPLYKAYNLDKQIVKFVKQVEKEIVSCSGQTDKIEKHFKGYVVYNDASQKRNLSQLKESITLSSQSYIHPNPAIFKRFG